MNLRTAHKRRAKRVSPELALVCYKRIYGTTFIAYSKTREWVGEGSSRSLAKKNLYECIAEVKDWELHYRDEFLEDQEAMDRLDLALDIDIEEEDDFGYFPYTECDETGCVFDIDGVCIRCGYIDCRIF